MRDALQDPFGLQLQILLIVKSNFHKSFPVQRMAEASADFVLHFTSYIINRNRKLCNHQTEKHENFPRPRTLAQAAVYPAGFAAILTLEEKNRILYLIIVGGMPATARNIVRNPHERTKSLWKRVHLVLKGADRVRQRPAVIFGSDGLEGCEHAVFEILSNAIDEAGRARPAITRDPL